MAAAFPRDLIKAVPYAIHTILTDNSIQFTNLAHHKHAGVHIFDRVCTENGIDHRLTKIKHPWTNGQVKRMNRTIKEATVKRGNGVIKERNPEAARIATKVHFEHAAQRLADRADFADGD